MCQRGISISKNSSEVAVGRLKEEDKKESVLNLLKTLASGDLVYEPLSSTPREPYVSVVTLLSGTIIIFFNLLYNPVIMTTVFPKYLIMIESLLKSHSPLALCLSNIMHTDILPPCHMG